MSSSVPYIGSKISLISNSEIRYEGVLYTINTQESTIALQSVRCFGTEGRKAQEIPQSSEVYDFIIFRGKDIKDLTVLEANSAVNDPAIVSINQRPPGKGGANKPVEKGAGGKSDSQDKGKGRGVGGAWGASGSAGWSGSAGAGGYSGSSGGWGGWEGGYGGYAYGGGGWGKGKSDGKAGGKSQSADGGKKGGKAGPMKGGKDGKGGGKDFVKGKDSGKGKGGDKGGKSFGKDSGKKGSDSKGGGKQRSAGGGGAGGGRSSGGVAGGIPVGELQPEENAAVKKEVAEDFDVTAANQKFDKVSAVENAEGIEDRLKPLSGYDKTKSFFDSISCEATERPAESERPKMDREKAREFDRETFGDTRRPPRPAGGRPGKGRRRGGGKGFSK